MPNDSERYAMLGYALASELMKRRRAGRTASAAELERSVSALIVAKPATGFKRFIAEEAAQSQEVASLGE